MPSENPSLVKNAQKIGAIIDKLDSFRQVKILTFDMTLKDFSFYVNIIYVVLLKAGGYMYKNFISVMYILNILWQSLFSLAFPIFLGFGAAWLLVTYAGTPTWIYALLGVLGTLLGFYNMIKFILTAMNAYERLEKSRERGKNTNNSGNNNE